jgi:DNA polymerase (family 10)
MPRQTRKDGERPGHGAPPGMITNREVAEALDDVARLLQEQDADRFRVAAYRRAAEVIRSLPEPVYQLFEREGLVGLDRLPGVGPAIASAIRSLIVTGHLPMLERLRGEAHPTSVLATVPGIGPKLAERLQEELGIHSLEELELAAHNGSLAAVAGFGAKRIRGIREALATRLGRGARLPLRVPRPDSADLPPVSELLDVDREYREKAAAGRLRKIAPRRFNPRGEAWLPVLHTSRAGRHYAALFSNTAQAHKLGKTNDWVVLYYDGPHGEQQATVLTATRGPCAGRRIVRGREVECERLCRGTDPAASAPS